jgi:hypothetical protein
MKRRPPWRYALVGLACILFLLAMAHSVVGRLPGGGGWHQVITWEAGSTASPDEFWDSASPVFHLHSHAPARLTYTVGPSSSTSVTPPSISVSSVNEQGFQNEAFGIVSPSGWRACDVKLDLPSGARSGGFPLCNGPDQGGLSAVTDAPAPGAYRLAVKAQTVSYSGEPPVRLTVWERSSYALGLPVIWLVVLLAGAVGCVVALVVALARRSPR